MGKYLQAKEVVKDSFWIVAAIIFSFLSIIINAYAWKYLIESLDCKTNNLNIVRIFINTNIYNLLCNLTI